MLLHLLAFLLRTVVSSSVYLPRLSSSYPSSAFQSTSSSSSSSSIVFPSLSSRTTLCGTTEGRLEVGRTNDSDSRWLTLVDCSYRNLSTLPADIPPGTHSLSLRGNSISVAEGHWFLPQFESLQRLDLSLNNISSLRSLMDVPAWMSLRYLDLAHNCIWSLERGVFDRAPKLSHLDLSHNLIRFLEDGCFSGLDGLAYLSLRNNQIARLSSATFDTLRGLTSVRLDNSEIGDSSSEDVIAAPLLPSSAEDVTTSTNEIKYVRSHSLSNLDRLRKIDISFNFIRSVVGLVALTSMRSLTDVTFDGNLIDRLSRPLDFQPSSSSSVRELSLCRMPRLSVVDEGAFLDLEDLEVLWLCENPRLIYIHPFALTRVSRLRVLDLRGNGLSAISEDLVLASASLELVRISENPLHCDCNARWISRFVDVETGSSASTNSPHRNWTFGNVSGEEDVPVCDSPADKHSISLRDLDFRSLPEHCRPVVVPLFVGSALHEIGSSATFSCRSIGLPLPKIHWILPSGRVVNGTPNDSRIRFESSGTLTVNHVKPTDYGTYTCLASNPKGYDAASVRLSIYASGVQILVKSVSSNFVSVTWNGTDSTISTANYVIIHWPTARGDNYGDYGRIPLRPYMRAFTVTNLDPRTSYEFCIACERVDSDGASEKISCISVSTKDYPAARVGISSLLDDSLAAEFLTVAALVLTIVLVLVVVGRFRRRRRSYREPRGFRLEKESSLGRLSGGTMPRHNSYTLPERKPSIPLRELLQRSPTTAVLQANSSNSRTSLLESYEA